jgi:hypothetical protein
MKREIRAAMVERNRTQSSMKLKILSITAKTFVSIGTPHNSAERGVGTPLSATLADYGL